MTRPNISFIYSLSLQIRPDFAGFESNILHLGHWIGKYQTFKNNIPDHFVMWKFWYIVRNIWNIRVKLFDVNINSLHMYVRALKWSVAMKPHVMHCPLKTFIIQTCILIVLWSGFSPPCPIYLIKSFLNCEFSLVGFEIIRDLHATITHLKELILCFGNETSRDSCVGW